MMLHQLRLNPMLWDSHGIDMGCVQSHINPISSAHGIDFGIDMGSIWDSAIVDVAPCNTDVRMNIDYTCMKQSISQTSSSSVWEHAASKLVHLGPWDSCSDALLPSLPLNPQCCCPWESPPTSLVQDSPGRHMHQYSCNEPIHTLNLYMKDERQYLMW